jgi:hypothetical protein
MEELKIWLEDFIEYKEKETKLIQETISKKLDFSYNPNVKIFEGEISMAKKTIDKIDQILNPKKEEKIKLEITTTNERFVVGDLVCDGVEVMNATPKLVDAHGLMNRRIWRKVKV